MAEWELPDSQLPVDPPLGADCDVDAIILNVALPLAIRQAMATTLLYIGDLLKIQASSFDEIITKATEMGQACLDEVVYPQLSSQCRGDGATGPGGGAPTYKEQT